MTAAEKRRYLFPRATFITCYFFLQILFCKKRLDEKKPVRKKDCLKIWNVQDISEFVFFFSQFSGIKSSSSFPLPLVKAH